MLKTRKTHLLISFLTSLLLLASLQVNAQWRGDSRAKLVVTQPIAFQNEQKKIEAVGSAEALRSVILYPAVADQVTDVNFVPGQFVEEGRMLVKLDDRKQQVAVERAKLQLADAERNYARLQQSFSRKATSQSELDDAKTVRDLAEVALAEAKADLEDRYIRAPFSGVVGLTDIEIGDRVTTQTIITTLDDRRKLFINFRTPEASVDLILNSPTVSLQPWSDRNTSLSAEIAQVDSRVNETDRTLRARAVLDNSEDKFRPGMSFRVSLVVDGERYAAIPEASLLWGATGAYIWLAENGKAKRVDVNVHQRLRGTILVSGELRDGDMLIAEGIQRLRNGQEVTTEIAATGVSNG